MLPFYVYLLDILPKKGFERFLLPGNWPQNWAHPLKREKFTSTKHRHVGCLSRGNSLQCWCIVLRFKFRWAYLEIKPQAAYSESALPYYAVGGFISRCAQSNLNLSTFRQHCRPLPLDRHPRCLCFVNVKFSLFNGWVPFWGKFPDSKKLWKAFFG